MKRTVRWRMYAAAEAMMPGLRSQDLAVVARAAADAARAMVGGAGPDGTPPREMTTDEHAALGRVAEVSAERFQAHLAKRSTAEAWKAFDVPWDYRRTLEAVESGRYCAELFAEALWVAETLAEVFAAPVPPRTVRQARLVGQQESALRGGTGLLAR